MLQLLRLADIEVVFQLRLPRFNQDYNDDRREQLKEMLAGLVGPGSAYGHFSVQRVLFESREKKRESAIVPDVDAADPYGTFMPSVSVVGPGVTRFIDPLLLPTLPPTVDKVVSGPLSVTGRVTQSDLADFADVSARSIRNNRELLEVVSLLDINEDGYRLALSFADERQTDVLPELVTSSIISVSDVTYELLCTTIEDADHRGSIGKSKLVWDSFWPSDSPVNMQNADYYFSTVALVE